MTDPERALIGLVEIAAYLETLYRRERNLRTRVTRRMVRRYVLRGLPAERLDAGGAWIARPSEVAEWWAKRRQSSTETVHDDHEGHEGQ